MGTPETNIDHLSLKLANGQHLSRQEAQDLFNNVLDGQISTPKLLTILKTLHDNGESTNEICGAVDAMMTHSLRVTLNENAFDLCGTGGSGKERFNVSTAAAFVLAAGGVPIAKHGNRGSKKPNGSFDFIDALGINIELARTEIEALFKKSHLCFLYARTHHPAVRFAADARKQLASRTIFNLIGPLSNPAGISHQLIGTPNDTTAKQLVNALSALKRHRACVVVGYDGLDEVSIAGPSQLYELNNAIISETTFEPQHYQLHANEDDIKGGSAKENAELFLTLLHKNDTKHPISQMIIANAGVAFYVAGNCPNIDEGIDRARHLLKSNKVLNKVTQIKTLAPKS